MSHLSSTIAATDFINSTHVLEDAALYAAPGSDLDPLQRGCSDCHSWPGEPCVIRETDHGVTTTAALLALTDPFQRYRVLDDGEEVGLVHVVRTLEERVTDDPATAVVVNAIRELRLVGLHQMPTLEETIAASLPGDYYLAQALIRDRLWAV